MNLISLRDQLDLLNEDVKVIVAYTTPTKKDSKGNLVQTITFKGIVEDISESTIVTIGEGIDIKVYKLLDGIVSMMAVDFNEDRVRIVVHFS